MCFNLLETERNHFSFKFKRMEVVVEKGFLFQFCELGCGDHPQEDFKPNSTLGWRGH
jgi:hypothetical protein